MLNGKTKKVSQAATFKFFGLGEERPNARNPNQGVHFARECTGIVLESF